MTGAGSSEGRLSHAAGRPRDPAVDRAILSATLELLGEHGYERMTIEAVARRAGVGKPTVYRRWSSKRDLVIDVLNHISDLPEMPAEGTARERLTDFMEEWWRLIVKAGHPSYRLQSLIGEMGRNPELGKSFRKALVDNRRKKIMTVLREGMESGELRPDLDIILATDMIFGTVIAQRLVSEARAGTDGWRRIVEYLFDGWT